MAQFKAHLNEILEKLLSKRTLLGRARRRYKANRKRAFVAHNKQLKAQKKADKLRAAGYEAEAQALDRNALRSSHIAYKNHARAQYWLGQIKILMRHIHKLDDLQQKVEIEMADWLKAHGVQIKGNTVTGGTAQQRWKAACIASVENCSTGKRRNFYSMSGAWDIDHVIVPGENYGERSDCSSTVTGWAKAAGLPDPNGADWTGGYTGTLVQGHNGWKKVSETLMKRIGWGYVVYGGGVGHHVEAYIGPGERTAGHGSAPVDFGVIDLFGDQDYRCYAHGHE